jgi:hypothetical protein
MRVSQMVSYEGVGMLNYWREATPVRGYISQRQFKCVFWFRCARCRMWSLPVPRRVLCLSADNVWLAAAFAAVRCVLPGRP